MTDKNDKKLLYFVCFFFYYYFGLSMDTLKDLMNSLYSSLQESQHSSDSVVISKCYFLRYIVYLAHFFKCVVNKDLQSLIANSLITPFTTGSLYAEELAAFWDQIVSSSEYKSL